MWSRRSERSTPRAPRVHVPSDDGWKSVPRLAAEQDEAAATPTIVTPAHINLPEYSRVFPAATPTTNAPTRRGGERSKLGGVSLLLESYPIIPGSPWHEEHVKVLKKHIGNTLRPTPYGRDALTPST